MGKLGDLLDLFGGTLLGLTFISWDLRKLVDMLGLGAPELGGWTACMEAQGACLRPRAGGSPMRVSLCGGVISMRWS